MENFTLEKKKQTIKKKLRKMGILPQYGEFLNETQQNIWNKINNNDFSYWDELMNKKREENKKTYKTPKSRHRRQYIRKRLRDLGIFPKLGEPLNEEQQKIENQIQNDDFSFWEQNFDKKSIEIKCLSCGDTNEYNFYPNRKTKCKKCVLVDLKVKYRNGELYQNIQKNKNWRASNLIHVRVEAAKHRAKLKNFEFDITDEIIEDKLKEQNYRCYYTNVQVDLKPHSIRSLSLDRIDSNIGYTKNNTVIVTWFVNQAKNKINSEDFINELKACCENMIK